MHNDRSSISISNMGNTRATFDLLTCLFGPYNGKIFEYTDDIYEIADFVNELVATRKADLEQSYYMQYVYGIKRILESDIGTIPNGRIKHDRIKRLNELPKREDICASIRPDGWYITVCGDELGRASHYLTKSFSN